MCVHYIIPRICPARLYKKRCSEVSTDDRCRPVEMGNRAAFVVAFLLRAIFGGMQIVTKAAFDEGMSTSVFVFYRHLTGILFLVPIAFVNQYDSCLLLHSCCLHDTMGE